MEGLIDYLAKGDFERCEELMEADLISSHTTGR